MISSILLSLVAGAATVSAHGYVTNIVVNGVSYAGYDVTKNPYMSDPPVVVGWGTTATDLGFVAPDAFGSSDIICHRGSTNAAGHAQVAAGDEVFLQWSTWPESHKGPVMSYLASCGDSGCESVDKTALEFFKIDEKGLIDGSSAPGTYAADQLEANGQGWMVKIPTDIPSGFYVLRHEIIALHSAGDTNGAQAYPQCINLEVTGGSGTSQPAGTLGTALYKADDAGIKVNIYVTTDTYAIPGPTMIAGATELATQSTSAITATGTATTGTALASGSAGATTSAAASGGAGNGSTTAAGSSATSATTSAGVSRATSAPAASSTATTAPAVSSAAGSSPAGRPTRSTAAVPTTLSTIRKSGSKSATAPVSSGNLCAAKTVVVTATLTATATVSA